MLGLTLALYLAIMSLDALRKTVGLPGSSIAAIYALTTIISSAPALLQPIIPGVGFHTANGGNIYLAPSIFADSEEACEQLIVALFAWTALMLAGSDSVKRGRFSVLGLIIFAGIIAAERRAGIYIAIVGLIVLLAVGGDRSPSHPHHLRRPARTGGGRWQLVLALSMTAVGSIVLIDVLGANLILSFLTSSSLGAPLRLMVASAHPGALTGQGTGTSTQGSYLLGATSFSGTNAQGPYTGASIDGRSFITAEGGLAKTWLELGLVGVILYGAVFVTVIGPVLRLFSKLDSIGRALLALTIGLGILFLKGHQSLDDPLIQPLFWMAAGGVWGRLRRPSAVASHDVLMPLSPGFERRPLSAGSS
jgi:hypothetical protein